MIIPGRVKRIWRRVIILYFYGVVRALSSVFGFRVCQKERVFMYPVSRKYAGPLAPISSLVGVTIVPLVSVTGVLPLMLPAKLLFLIVIAILKSPAEVPRLVGSMISAY
jgi:hypothetical protein